MTTTNRTGVTPALVAPVVLGLWGVIHVVGGLSLLADGSADALRTLGPSSTDSVPARPGEVTEAVLRFHSLNILLGGVAVLGLSIAWWRSRLAWQLAGALGIGAALDIGLIAFMVVPGILPANQGLIGPVLVAIAAVAVLSTRRSPTAPVRTA